MKNILVFNKNCFPISATFIHRQITGSIPLFNIYVAALSYQNRDRFSLKGIVAKIKLSTYDGVVDKVLTVLNRKFFSAQGRISVLSRWRLVRFIKKNRIDIIHVHYGTWGVELLPIAKALKIPLIVSFHGYDASKAIRDDRYKKRLSKLFQYASRIIIVSEHMRSMLELSAWDAKTSLIPYGVDIHRFFKPDRPRLNAEIKILSSGRIVPKKGVPDLIAVFAELIKSFNHTSLHIVGGGEELEKCKSIVTRLGISNQVYFYGSQPEGKVIEMMQECDIFVLNSRIAEDGDMEGLPNALLEAMSSKMAVVSTYHAGIPTAVENEVSGILVPEKDNSSLLLALSRLLRDLSLMERLGTNARHRIGQQFTIDKMRSRINSVYEEVSR